MLIKKIHTLKSKQTKKAKSLAIVKLSDTMFVRNIDVKREWIYAELVIQILDHPYLGKWTYKDTLLSATLGDKMLENLVIPIKKKKRDWDKTFWDTASMIRNSAYDAKAKDLNQIWNDTSIIAKKRQMEKVASEEEKAEEIRILKHSW